MITASSFTKTKSSPSLFPAVTVTVVGDTKIRTALRTNQIAGFVTVPSRKKIKTNIPSLRTRSSFQTTAV